MFCRQAGWQIVGPTLGVIGLLHNVTLEWLRQCEVFSVWEVSDGEEKELYFCSGSALNVVTLPFILSGMDGFGFQWIIIRMSVLLGDVFGLE